VGYKKQVIRFLEETSNDLGLTEFGFIPKVMAAKFVRIDFDSIIFLIIFYPIQLFLNVGHTYVMYQLSEQWAEMSDILLALSFIHYMQSFLCTLLVYDDGIYMFRLKDIRIISMYLAYVSLVLYCVSFGSLIILLFGSQNIEGIVVSLLVGYLLIIMSTLLPSTILIIVKEATENIMMRNDKYSEPGSYFSFYEFMEEFLGEYEDDTRLHDYNQKKVDELLGLTGLVELSNEFLPAKLFVEWVTDIMEMKTLDQQSSDVYVFITMVTEVVMIEIQNMIENVYR
jgi:hypothetical protein